MTSQTIFTLTSIVLIIPPGPDLIYVLTRGISGGKDKFRETPEFVTKRPANGFVGWPIKLLGVAMLYRN